ncbi:unnamed protein product [Allacma fusca]|uniref:Fatty acyl-CoA reductase n=1 Tax=Allacma fusca TaxID=39272 RepID=A0A8J2J6W9_9HEXA|nr:unnamed protein product [Allacma fusca]
MAFESSEIVEFFTGKTILLTGGTGFLGKALIQKILNSCPEVGKIFVLIRDKRNQCPAARLKNLLNEPIFEELKTLQPNFHEKVEAIPGDISIPKLGICCSDLEVLQKNVSIIIHSAATVRFNSPLKEALNINLQGTGRLLEMATEMKLLQAFVHVSTAFSNCEWSLVEEKIYPVEVTPQDALYFVNNLNDKLLESISPSLIKDKPNTYTFSKQLTETLIDQWKAKLPICIVRPSVITATEKDPIPGFADNFAAMSGVLAGVMTGCIHALHLNDEFRIDIIPLDYVVNLILAATYRLGKTEERSNLQIYNLSSCENSFNCKTLNGTFEQSCYKNPVSKMMTYPYAYLITNRTVFKLCCFYFHRVPAMFFDAVAGIMGKEKLCMPIYKKVAESIDVLEYFTVNKWTFKSDSTKALYNSLSPQDKSVFNFNVQDIDWDSYVVDYASGVRKYALKETNQHQGGKKRLLQLRVFDLCLKLLPVLPIILVFLC